MSRRVLLPFLLALIGTVVVFGAVRAFDEDDAPPPTVAEHVFDASYAGPVWITVTSQRPERQTLLLRWGTWERTVEHEGTEPVTYVFTKGGLDRGPPEPLTVEVPTGGAVDFGQGLFPPSPSVSIREGWVQVPGGATTSGA